MRVLAVFLGALVLGLGVIGFQAFGGHDADAAGGHDLAHGDHDPPAWALVASLRFWSFGLLAFGLSGLLLALFGLAGVLATTTIAALAGATSGAFASTVLRRMRARGPSSQVAPRDVVGKIGRVLVPSDPARRGKVRVEIKGGIVDYVAASRDALQENDVVVVEDFDGQQVTVSKAPKELKP
jgi:membrane protein implicated in regulation of membrane protease activity